MKRYVALWLLLAAIFSCQKPQSLPPAPKPPEPPRPCTWEATCMNLSSPIIRLDTFLCDSVSIPPPPFGLGYNIRLSKYFYSGLFSNPCNPDKGILVVADRELGWDSLCAINFCTGIKRCWETKISSVPQWGATGWLVYVENNRIYKMKPDGDSLTLLSQGGRFNYDPSWSPDGKKIVYVRDAVEWIIMDREGGVLDTCRVRFGTTKYRSPAWSPNGQYLAGRSSEGLGVFDAQTKKLLISTSPQTVLGFRWMPDNQRLIWAGRALVDGWKVEGLYMTDIRSGETELIKQRCSNSFYIGPGRVSPDGKKVLLLRHFMKHKMPGHYLYKWDHLTILDLETLEEWYIDLEG